MPKATKVKFACVQMCSTPDKMQNIFEMREHLAVAAAKGAKLVAFPENCTILTDDSSVFASAVEPEKGPTNRLFSEWASLHKVWLLIGSVPLVPRRSFSSLRSKRGEPKATNSSLLFNPQGKLVARYDKIHLFDVNLSADRKYAESDKIQAGRRTVLAATPWGGLGLSICYDLRFPELYREYADHNAMFISIPAAFTKVTGQAHWDVLTRARAIENQCFALCAAQVGKYFAGRETYGHTRIIDPWGQVLAEKTTGEGVVCATLDMAELQRIRRELPALKHR